MTRNILRYHKIGFNGPKTTAYIKVYVLENLLVCPTSRRQCNHFNSWKLFLEQRDSLLEDDSSDLTDCQFQQVQMFGYLMPLCNKFILIRCFNLLTRFGVCCEHTYVPTQNGFTLCRILVKQVTSCVAGQGV